jgi:hypothetical protein
MMTDYECYYCGKTFEGYGNPTFKNMTLCHTCIIDAKQDYSALFVNQGMLSLASFNKHFADKVPEHLVDVFRIEALEGGLPYFRLDTYTQYNFVRKPSLIEHNDMIWVFPSPISNERVVVVTHIQRTNDKILRVAREEQLPYDEQDDEYKWQHWMTRDEFLEIAFPYGCKIDKTYYKVIHLLYPLITKKQLNFKGDCDMKVWRTLLSLAYYDDFNPSYLNEVKSLTQSSPTLMDDILTIITNDIYQIKG